MITDTQKAIGSFEIVDHGIEGSQYFQGCGVSFTEFSEVVTGIGDNPAAALDDCLEQMASNGWETEGMEKRILSDIELSAIPTIPSVSAEYDTDDEGGGGNAELWYHLSIRWNQGRIGSPHRAV